MTPLTTTGIGAGSVGLGIAAGLLTRTASVAPLGGRRDAGDPCRGMRLSPAPNGAACAHDTGAPAVLARSVAHRSSLLQDIEAGRRTAIDTLNGIASSSAGAIITGSMNPGGMR